jgi:DNA-binding MarR family transcriptional regulator
MNVNGFVGTIAPVPPQEPDAVDRIAGQWHAVRPDLDVTPMTVIGRVSRLSRLVDRRLAANFARFGIESWMYDVLATLRRSGEPYELTAGDLVRQSMVTTGAITNRIDRLVARGLVSRATDPDNRRQVLIGLTAAGRALVDELVVGHLAAEQRLLSGLSERDQQQLARLLRKFLLHHGDGPAAADRGD